MERNHYRVENDASKKFLKFFLSFSVSPRTASAVYALWVSLKVCYYMLITCLEYFFGSGSVSLPVSIPSYNSTLLIFVRFKASHLVYIVPRWYGSRIYADCPQKLFWSEHDTGERFLLITFLAEQKRDYDAQRVCVSLFMVFATSLLECTWSYIYCVTSKTNLLLYQLMVLL